jgi:hypothetical protein
MRCLLVRFADFLARIPGNFHAPLRGISGLDQRPEVPSVEK